MPTHSTRKLTRILLLPTFEGMRDSRMLCTLLMIIMLFLPACSLAQNRATVTDTGLERVPASDEIFKTLRPKHPRLLATRADFDRIKKQIQTDPLMAKWHDQLLKQADAIAKAKPVSMGIEVGNRTVLTGYGQLRQNLEVLGMLYQLHHDQKYVDLAWRDMQAAFELKSWNPKHFLGVAETSHALAIGYDWLYDGLSADQRHIIEQNLQEKALKIAQAAYHGWSLNGWWVAVRDNWNQVCNGAMGMAALAIAESNPELTADILTNAIRYIPVAMTSYAPDGAWREGLAYWGYGGRYNIQFIASLDSALGTDFGLSTMKGFSRTGEFPIQMTGPTGEAFNFADSPTHTHSRMAMMLWLAKRFNRPIYAQTYLASSGGGVEDLLWYDAKLAHAKPIKPLPLDSRFEGADLFSFRSSWTDPNATWIAFKAGDNKDNHSHLDLGSFVMEALGHRWAVDLGTDSYELPDYFHSKRWLYYRTRTESHNTLLTNPSQSPGQDPKAKAQVIDFQANPDGSGAKAVIDLSQAYSSPKSVMRTISRQGRNIRIEDDIQFNAQGTKILWLFHTPAKVEILKDGAMLTIKNDKLKLHLIEPANARFEVGPSSPLPTSPNPDGQTINQGISQISLTFVSDAQETPLKIVVELIPQTP